MCCGINGTMLGVVSNVCLVTNSMYVVELKSVMQKYVEAIAAINIIYMESK